MKKMKTRITTKKGLSIVLSMFMIFGTASTSLSAFATNVAEINATNFPDATWRTFVSTNYDTNSDGYLSETEAAAPTSINVASSGIADLKGIEYFVNLQTLRCYDNDLTALDVTANTKLSDLRFQDNQITSIDLSHNPDLYRLYAYNNALTNLDVTANEDLLYLYCYNNQISSLNVSTNTALLTLHCYGNQLSTLDVTNNTALTALNSGAQTPTLNLQYVSGQYYVALSGPNYSASRITNLSFGTADARGITLGSNFANIPATITYSYNTAWSGGTNTISVTATINKGVAINATNFPDTNFRNFVTTNDTDSNGFLSVEEASQTYINVSNSSIADLTGIEYFKKIEILDCSNNPLTVLNVSQNTDLTHLLCDYGQLTSLDVSKNTELLCLSCYDNQLESLDISNNTKLTTLECAYNLLPALDVSNNTALTRLVCGSNQLTELDISNNTALTRLSCAINQLTELDISNNTALTSLSCDSNQLTELDISNNTALTSLSCDSNQLTELDISNNAALTILSCGSNQLTELDISNNTALTSLGCNSNQLAELDVSNCPNLIYYTASTQYITSGITEINGKYYFVLSDNNSFDYTKVTNLSAGTADATGIYFDNLSDIPYAIITYTYATSSTRTMNVVIWIAR